MSAEPRVADIARRLLAVRRGAAPIEVETMARMALSRTQAYAIQAQVMRELGAVGGWKCGGPSPQAEHILAPIPAGRVFATPSVQDAADYRLIGIELEVGFVLERLPSSADLAGELPLCAKAMAAIEIVDSRLCEPDKAPAAWKLADMQLNGGLLCAPAIADWQALDLTAPRLELVCDGQTLVQGRNPCPGGPPIEVLARFLRACGAHCGGVQPGQPIITGSLTGLRFIQPGSRVQAWIEGLGELSVEFERR